MTDRARALPPIEFPADGGYQLYSSVLASLAGWDVKVRRADGVEFTGRVVGVRPGPVPVLRIEQENGTVIPVDVTAVTTVCVLGTGSLSEHANRLTATTGVDAS